MFGQYATAAKGVPKPIPMGGIPQPQGSYTGLSGTGPMAMPKAPIGMATRPPVIANKARGTMASHFRQEVRNAIPSVTAAFKR